MRTRAFPDVALAMGVVALALLCIGDTASQDPKLKPSPGGTYDAKFILPLVVEAIGSPKRLGEIKMIEVVSQTKGISEGIEASRSEGTERWTKAIGTRKWKCVSTFTKSFSGPFERVMVRNEEKAWEAWEKNGRMPTKDLPVKDLHLVEATSFFGLFDGKGFSLKPVEFSKDYKIVKGPLIADRKTFGFTALKNGWEHTYYYWDDTKLLAKHVFRHPGLEKIQFQKGTSIHCRNELFYENYKDVDGIKIAHKTRLYMYDNGNNCTDEAEQIVTSLRFFDQIDEKVFAKP